MQDHLDKSIQKHLKNACSMIRDMSLELRDKTFQLTKQSEKLTHLAAEQVRDFEMIHTYRANRGRSL